ncbi:putative ribonuclease H-like domain-containing protein [Tanacetum coccineum]
MTQTVPSKSTANVTYQGTARSRVPQAALSRSIDGSYYPRMDNRRPRISSYSPLSRSSNPRTTYRQQRPKKTVKSIWVKKGSTVGSQAVLPQTVKKSAMINPKQTWRPKGNYLDSVNRDNGSYTLKQFEAIQKKIFKDYAIIYSGSLEYTGYKDKLEEVRRCVTDDCSKFSWVFFLAYKDETYDMLHDLIVGLENRLRHKVKTIRCDNGTEFKNQLLNEFCAKKGIKREYSIARTPQQNGVAERKNRTLIEAARTMLADSLLPIQFWAEAVNTACYVLNRVLVTKPQMKTPYEILMGRSPNISFMRPFGCPLTILNTLDHLGKFDGKSEEGYLLGYSTNSKGFRVYNRITRKVQDCLHVNFLENQENQKGKGPDWMFDLDLLTPSMNYIPVRKENYADSKEQGISCDDVEDLDDQQFIVHTAQPMHTEERTAAKEVPLSSAEQALHDELVSLMHQESLAKAHNDDQRIAFEEEKKGGKKTRKHLTKGKECVDQVLSTSKCQLIHLLKVQEIHLQDSMMDIPNVWCFSTTLLKMRNAELADYNNMDPYHCTSQKKCNVQSSSEDLKILLKPHKVYRVCSSTYCLPQAPRAWYERLSLFFEAWNIGESSMVKDFEDLMQKEFKMSSMGELTFFLGLQVKQSIGGIFLSQDKYVTDILNKFDFRTIKPASTPIEAHKSLGKDEEGEDVDVHLYRSMIGCLMYLTASRPDIMFAVCLCARFQVTPKVSHLHAVKRIFRYLKHQPKLGLWYPKDSPFHLEAFSDSDYAGDNHDRRSTSGGCQYLGRRLVSWQCKKQTIVAISSTEAEYVAAASCCAQVLWMQNQLLDYGFNFMNTEIHIDNESTICIVKNPVFHSKTKHIQIRHHFIRDCYEQRLINVVKVHTDDNVADLLTKGFDLARFNFLVVTIGMMNP